MPDTPDVAAIRSLLNDGIRPNLEEGRALLAHIDTLTAAVLTQIRGEMTRRERPDYFLGFEVVRGILDNIEDAAMREPHDA